eukprot:364644-Chlamydomonas_euryale.AAC.5
MQLWFLPHICEPHTPAPPHTLAHMCARKRSLRVLHACAQPGSSCFCAAQRRARWHATAQHIPTHARPTHPSP